MLFINCSLFSPAEIEQKPVKIVESDPFNWEGILSSSDYNILQFVDYTDVFHNDFNYENASMTFESIRFNSRLNTIVKGCDSMDVYWENNTGLEDPSFENVTTVELRERDYIVDVWKGTTFVEYTGTVNFTFEKDAEEDRWYIKKWRDINDNSGLSFFNPDFK